MPEIRPRYVKVGRDRHGRVHHFQTVSDEVVVVSSDGTHVTHRVSLSGRSICEYMDFVATEKCGWEWTQANRTADQGQRPTMMKIGVDTHGHDHYYDTELELIGVVSPSGESVDHRLYLGDSIHAYVRKVEDEFGWKTCQFTHHADPFAGLGEELARIVIEETNPDTDETTA